MGLPELFTINLHLLGQLTKPETVEIAEAFRLVGMHIYTCIFNILLDIEAKDPTSSSNTNEDVMESEHL